MTEPPIRSRTPVIIGFLIAGAVILGASFLVGSLDESPAGALPPLSILAPATGDTIANPLTIRFATSAPLALDPAMGWTADELHLHAMISGREIMPAAADITADGNAWTWTLPPLEPGSYSVHLSWAGRHHGNLGGTDSIRVYVR